MLEKLLTAQQVAEVLQLSASKVYRIMQRGEIPTVRMGRAVRVREQDLLAYISQNIQPKATSLMGDAAKLPPLKEKRNV